MKKLIVSSLVGLAAILAAAPALGQQVRKTDLVAADGASVDLIVLRHVIDAGWVIDNQNLLYRDSSRDHYLVTLKGNCAPLDIRTRSFAFRPAPDGRLLATREYDVRPEAGPRCDVAKIAQLDEARGDAVRATASRRVW